MPTSIMSRRLGLHGPLFRSTGRMREKPIFRALSGYSKGEVFTERALQWPCLDYPANSHARMREHSAVLQGETKFVGIGGHQSHGCNVIQLY